MRVDKGRDAMLTIGPMDHKHMLFSVINEILASIGTGIFVLNYNLIFKYLKVMQKSPMNVETAMFYRRIDYGRQTNQ